MLKDYGVEEQARQRSHPEDISWFQFVFQNFENNGDKTPFRSC